MLLYSEVPAESFLSAPLRHRDEDRRQQRGIVAAGCQSDRPRRPRAGHPLRLVTPSPAPYLATRHTEFHSRLHVVCSHLVNELKEAALPLLHILLQHICSQVPPPTHHSVLFCCCWFP